MSVGDAEKFGMELNATRVTGLRVTVTGVVSRGGGGVLSLMLEGCRLGSGSTAAHANPGNEEAGTTNAIMRDKARKGRGQGFTFIKNQGIKTALIG